MDDCIASGSINDLSDTAVFLGKSIHHRRNAPVLGAEAVVSGQEFRIQVEDGLKAKREAAIKTKNEVAKSFFAMRLLASSYEYSTIFASADTPFTGAL